MTLQEIIRHSAKEDEKIKAGSFFSEGISMMFLLIINTIETNSFSTEFINENQACHVNQVLGFKD